MNRFQSLRALTRAEQSILAAVVEGPGAWALTGRLLARVRPRRAAVAAVAALEAAGWVARWTADRAGRKLKRERCTLTPWGAEQMGFMIDDLEGDRIWIRSSEAMRPYHAAQRRLERRLWHPHLIRDDRLLLDEGGAPVEILGRPVLIDRRLGRGSGRRK